jgi:hypothetical protein
MTRIMLFVKDAGSFSRNTIFPRGVLVTELIGKAVFVGIGEVVGAGIVVAVEEAVVFA